MNYLDKFVKKESSAGILHIFVTILALQLKDLALSGIYITIFILLLFSFLNADVGLRHLSIDQLVDPAIIGIISACLILRMTKEVKE